MTDTTYADLPEHTMRQGCTALLDVRNYYSRFQPLIGCTIALVNYVFRFIIMWNIRALKYYSLSKETTITKWYIEKVGFFNKCLLIIMASADFEFSSSAFNGQYSDFNNEWYQHNGNIIIFALLTQVWIPILNYFFYVFYIYVFQAYDQQTLRPKQLPNKTRSETVSQYFELYAGPDYEIHFKYAEIENITCLCCVFGPGIPMLFPIGLVCIVFI